MSASLELYTTQDELEAQWLLLQRVPEPRNVYALARFAEARAIVAARKVIAERDRRIKKLEAQVSE